MISAREFIAYNYGALCTLQGMPASLKSLALESIAKDGNMTTEELDVFIKEIQESLKFSNKKKMDQVDEMLKTGKPPKDEFGV